jgi:molybdopterin synthase sulfur carrier subunit
MAMKSALCPPLRAADNSPLELARNFFEDTKTMAVKVRIPTPLRKLTNDQEVVDVTARTIGDAISELQGLYPGIKERLVDETGAVRRFVNVYVNEEDIRFLQNQQTPLKDGDEVSIIPAIAGG